MNGKGDGEFPFEHKKEIGLTGLPPRGTGHKSGPRVRKTEIMNSCEKVNPPNLTNRQFLFQAIYETCYKTVESLAKSAGTNIGESNDIAQVVFMRFNRALMGGKFPDTTVENWKNNGHMVEIRTWLFSATLLVTREFGRKRRRQDTIRRNCPRGCCGVDQSARFQLLTLLVNEALDQCSPMERSVVTMKINGYSCKEIAETIDRSTSTIRGHLMSARARVRDWLGDGVD